MATVVDHQPKFKHYCRICKKGFGCGRALGGHMRAHGIGGEGNGNIEEEEEEEEEEEDDEVGSDWGEKVGGNQPPGSSKRMYALRTKTNRLKNCRTCENCGKEFSSWKSFLDHGKCSSADAESLVSSKGSDDEDVDEDGAAPRGYGWSKGRRSRRAINNNNKLGTSNCPSSEEEDLANCLVMLSNAAHGRVMVDPLVVVAETEESCASASKEEEERRKPATSMAMAALLTTNTTNRVSNVDDHYHKQPGKGVSNTTNIKGMFECKACKKVFTSHQALGGHRASHKKVKGCFASKIEDNLDESLIIEEDVITNEEFSIPAKSTAQPPLQLDHHNHHQQSSSYKKKSKVHECSICHRIFSSGQALGGHKRCHWLTSSNSTDTSSIINKFHSNQHQFQDHPSTTKMHHLQHQLNQTLANKSNLSDQPTLDLNLPAPIDDHNSTTGSSVKHETRARLSFEMPTEIYLQPWIQTKDHISSENIINNNNNKSLSLVNQSDHKDNIDNGEEGNNKVKLSKISNIKDINMGGGGSFTWLQVGIGSSTSNP